ncbi:MAG: hypothetical protein H6Q80_1493, partial [Deltaproteobacteria bacterium]|nr:hypothetical protein [Deltaproteobacteria bacterium]
MADTRPPPSGEDREPACPVVRPTVPRPVLPLFPRGLDVPVTRWFVCGVPAARPVV